MKHGLILVVGAAAALGCARLGVWQLGRLHERQALNAAIQSQRARSPVTVTETLLRDDLDSLVQRRATAAGAFDFERQVVVWLRPLNGVPGVHVVTPLMVDDSLAVLVERAWLPAPDGARADLALVREPAEAAVTGYLHPGADARQAAVRGGEFPLGVRSADPIVLGARFPYRLFPLVLRRSTAPPDAPMARAVPDPPLTEGSHRSYAIQWFGFATIALVGSVLLYRKERAGDVGRET